MFTSGEDDMLQDACNVFDVSMDSEEWEHEEAGGGKRYILTLA
jgi:hypothetical protein